MKHDISDLLRDWPFDPDHNIRIINIGKERDVMQVRQPMGIEQYELDGRPDGIRPFGKETFLTKMQDRLKDHLVTVGNEDGFVISEEDFIMLQNEGILFYYRYLHLFQINDFKRTARDTEHNLRICDFVEKYAGKEVESEAILQYKPYILRMHAVARAMSILNDNVRDEAVQVLEDAIDEIEVMPEVDTPAFKFEKIRSIQYLQSTLKQISEGEDDPVHELQQELEAAVEAEEYELAAELRDRIEELTRLQKGQS